MMQMNQFIGQYFEQKMNQVQLQGLELLAMSETELYQKIMQEAAENPALEIIDSKRRRQERTVASAEKQHLPAYRNNRVSSISPQGKEDSDAFQSFIENIPETRSNTLQAHLLEQVRLEPLSDAVLHFSERIIQNLDEDGFHAVPLTELFVDEIHQPRKRKEINTALTVVQNLEPIGCGTKDFSESLLVQAKICFINKKESIYAYAIDILEKHFSYLEKVQPYSLVQRINKDAALSYKITQEQAAEILQIIGTLDPFPGRRYANSNSRIDYIIPTVFIERKDEEFSVRINNSELPSIAVSPEILALTEKESHDSDVQAYIKPHIQKAKIFIGSLNNREKTILTVVKKIIKAQEHFFITGNKQRLVPLTQQLIAQELNIHESTISRAISNKYLQCEWGIFEIKFFFPSSISAQLKTAVQTTVCTKEAVKELLMQLLSNSEKKISDQKLSELLKEKYGVQLARRTINKYRKELNTL